MIRLPAVLQHTVLLDRIGQFRSIKLNFSDYEVSIILVPLPVNIDMFRATQQRQDKAQSAENGAPLSRAATPYWRCCVAPCGRAGKRSPAALRRLARTRHSRRGVPCAQPLPDPLNMSILTGKGTSLASSSASSSWLISYCPVSARKGFIWTVFFATSSSPRISA